jgi:hypothetical protein
MAGIVTSKASVEEKSSSWSMNNLHMQFYADHLWLFYQCGDKLYFNHEVRDKRKESETSLAFNWLTHSTMIGIRYCDGFGHSFMNTPVSVSSSAQSVVLPSKMYLFFKPKSNSTTIKFKTYKGRPTGNPNKNKWTKDRVLTSNTGSPIKTRAYSAFEAGGELYVAYVKNSELFVRMPDAKIKKIKTQNSVMDTHSIKAISTVTKTGPSVIFQYVAKQPNSNLRYEFTLLNLNDFVKGHIDPQNFNPKFFYSPSEIKSLEMMSELNGNIFLQYIKNGKRQRTQLDTESFEPMTFNVNDNFVTAFTSKESKAYGTVQLPINCRMNTDCKLINFNYPKYAQWLQDPSKLLHLAYAGKVVVQPLDITPVEHDQMELLGIIEGPPPVPLENVLASFAALPPAFVLNAARGLSRVIKTNIAQVLTMKNSETKEESSARLHAISANASVPLALPVKMSGMASVKNKVTNTQNVNRTNTIKKTYSNEIQHTSKGENLIMKPVGKLIFLKYDITGFVYKFMDKSNRIMEEGPSLYSLSKTNVRPVIRQYDMIAKVVNPNKYQNHIQVGNLQSYTNMHRRRNLMNRAAELAPGHNYLSFTYNNALDLATEVNISTSKTISRSTTDTLSLEGTVGTGLDGIFGAEIMMASEEERTYSVSNTQENGMAINVNMGFVVPTEDERVKFYDFEVFYLQPSKDNLKDLLEELQDTKAHSKWNTKAYAAIKRDSQPWKITYTVSNIINNDSLDRGYKEDLLGDGLSLHNHNDEHEGDWKSADNNMPKTLFSLYERCTTDEAFATKYERACQRVVNEMQ